MDRDTTGHRPRMKGCIGGDTMRIPGVESHRRALPRHIPWGRALTSLLVLFAAALAQAAPTVSLTAPASGATYLAPATSIAVSASASVTAPATIARVEFYANGVLIGTDTASPYSIAWTSAGGGAYILTAVAYDSSGASTTSAARSITVTASNTAPTATLSAPAAGAKFVLPATITVSAGATAPEVNDTVARVEFYANGVLIGSDTTSPYTVAWANPAAGSYSLTAKAVDGKGAETVSAARGITVSATNTPPTVALSAPAAGAKYLLPATLTVSASATAPETNDAVARVEFYANGTLIGSDTTSPYTIAWTNPAAGSYSLTAKAVDGKGAETVSTARGITVSDTNAPPTVALSAPAAGAKYLLPATITVSASATAPETNDAVARVEFYANGTLIGTDTASPYSIAWTPTVAGSYTLSAKAVDGQGVETMSVARTVTVTDTNTPPTVSLTAPANGAAYAAPASLTVSASASAGDANDTLSRVEFYANDLLIGTDTTSPYGITWGNVAAGSYRLTARALDNHGAQTVSAARTITVNGAPTVTLTSPGNGATFAPGTTVSLAAAAADPGGSIVRVEFYRDATLLASDVAAPYAYDWASVPAGSYTLTAKAVDNQGNTTVSAPVAITVTAGSQAALYFIHADHLNTPRALADAQGRTVWQWENADPFGGNPPDEDPDADGRRVEFNLRFPGQHYDRETALHYNYFRDYDPTIGRYVQSDPIGLRGGINPYTYVGGDPMSEIDAMGLRRWRETVPSALDEWLRDLPDPRTEWPGLLAPELPPCVPTSVPECWWECPPAGMCTGTWGVPANGGPRSGCVRKCMTGPFISPRAQARSLLCIPQSR